MVGALALQHNLVHSAREELQSKAGKGFIKDNLGILHPYAGTTATEFMNQTPLMVALYLKYKVKDLKGNERLLIDAIKADGEWNTEEFGEAGDWTPGTGANWKGLHNQLMQLTAGVHGDYRRFLKMRDNVLLLAMGVFRTWMYEGFANKFEREKYDSILKITRKGRYRTGFTVFNTGAKLKPGIVGENDYTYFDNVMYNLQQLGRKLVFLKTNFDERYTEVDAANMRKNLNEILAYMSLMSLYLVLKSIKGDEPDKEKKQLYSYFLNAGLRLQQDMTFYFSVSSFEQLNSSISPAFSTITETSAWFNAVGNLIYQSVTGGDDIIPTGSYAGESKFVVQSFKTFPILYPIHRLRTSTIFNQ
jgi:hypothetical protein